ncbi:MAG: 1-acyl-sn-glycerol-3-phosphate acyltransferase [Gammaproteobacteria bacterium]|nr:1-acyl-sn-glycerol-3-phosphate acyltransferase [Gammaproteobacteria bacterium]
MSVEQLRKKSLGNLLKLPWHVFRMLLISYKYRFCALVGGWIDKEGWLEYRTSSLYGRALLAYMGHEVEVKGLEHLDGLEGNYVVAANHASYLDWPLLLAYFPTHLRFIAKKELTHIPALGSYAAKRGILIDRGGSKAAFAKIEQGITDSDPTPILIFPEGTRSADGQPRKFKRGGLALFCKYDWPIVPVTITGTHEYLPRDAVMFKSGGHFTMIVSKPLYRKDFNSDDALIGAVQERVHQIFHEVAA